jgi:hypothetical protein
VTKGYRRAVFIGIGIVIAVFVFARLYLANHPGRQEWQSTSALIVAMRYDVSPLGEERMMTVEVRDQRGRTGIDRVSIDRLKALGCKVGDKVQGRAHGVRLRFDIRTCGR